LQQLHRAAAFNHDLPRLDEFAVNSSAGNRDDTALCLAALLGIEAEEPRTHAETVHPRQVVRRIGIEQDGPRSQLGDRNP
jgi:hypothetical protein